jgi:glycosyltransferase involved in cell wall biosynthesis
MVVDTAWDRRLGAPRVQIELADQLRRLGHHVDSFSSDDAYGSPPPIARFAGVTRNFPLRAARHIRANPGRYDVIDARHGTLLADKRSLSFSGLLVTRSVGLLPVYEREFVNADRRTPEARGRWLLRPLLAFEVEQARRRARLAFEHADLVNVLNREEHALCEELGFAEKTVTLHLGLSERRRRRFDELRRPPGERLAARRIAFIGSWCRRKGSHDMARIMRGVLAAEPRASFLLLGTGLTAEQVLRELAVPEARVEVRPCFDVDDLPQLLQDVTAGMLPSYVEGFPFAIIDSLGAGLPIVVYDVPGSREILPRIDPSLLVAPGDTTRFAARLADILAMDEAAYAALGAEAAALAAAELCWEEIAAETARTYRARLERVRGAAPAPHR